MEEHKKHAEHHKHKAHEHRHTGSKNTNPNMKFWVMAIALALLILISGVQAVELVGLKNKLNNDLETLSVSSKKSTVSTGQSSGGLSNNLNNLPTMVGGC
ncbi:MAG: hypothetical protein QF436_00540 [Candidatus Woesearchaeota archaeon]|jgi:Na+/H+ antiporter NhaD/arsenite permease-like protein|nr:hypothetical protein [archaeon]MDP6547992.1 hypothetical protein [Candidatus Woesearchaeota archaeon]MDP7263601.1 hypothetical protein [Candidatus Woesearchaeota archaeon]MDP7622586.1 hypothetical protein [Candidatus Woesearchaeota archaeon]HJN57298.1 hypothetical protein [Candidatus Woesearchaeota archaeon]|tara:strand:+ start:26650 stop:26949 length:300 start_codon:yes stop_codon:yes gene_type:complete